MKKNILILFVIAAVFLLTGCGNSEKGILGKWEGGEWYYIFKEDGTCEISHISCIYIHDIETKTLTINFLSSNGSVYNKEIINYNLKGDILEVKIHLSAGTQTGTFYRKYNLV